MLVMSAKPNILVCPLILRLKNSQGNLIRKDLSFMQDLPHCAQFKASSVKINWNPTLVSISDKDSLMRDFLKDLKNVLKSGHILQKRNIGKLHIHIDYLRSKFHHRIP
jgi:predicted alpha/beta hydrolase family esterase